MIRQAVIRLGESGTTVAAPHGAVDWQMMVAGRTLLHSYIAHLAAFGVRAVMLAGSGTALLASAENGSTVCGAVLEVMPGPSATLPETLHALHARLDQRFLVAEWPYRLSDIAAFVAAPPTQSEEVRRLVGAEPAADPMGLVMMPRTLVASCRALDRSLFRDWTCTGDVIDFGADLRNARASTALETALRRPAAFLDRDGVINVDHGYVHRCEDLVFTPTAVAGIRRLNRAGYRVLVVTNQAGVARGYYGVADIERFHDHMQQRLLEQGAHIDGFYYSPTHPQGSVAEFARENEDRKPGPGMLLRAMRDWPTDIRRSFLIGDKPSDVEAATRAGVTGVRVPADICDLAAEADRLIARFAT